MVKISCALCRVSCTSFRSLSEHVIGQKHRSLVKRGSLEEVQQLGRLQYFINTQMKGLGILGLEYVVERKSDGSYIYTCTLCDVVQNCHGMVGHVTDVEHMAKYIYTHHRHLHDPTKYPTKRSHLEALGKVAMTICNSFGHKQVRVESSVGSQDMDTVAGPSPKEGGEQNGNLPPVGEDLQTESAQEGLAKDFGKQRLKCSKNKDTDDFYFCDLCDIIFVSASIMCQHVIGIKHYKKMLLTAPKQVKELRSLSYLLRTYLKEVPILGLEYISEVNEGSLYKFSCQLCGVEGNLQIIVTHILNVEHMEFYIKKHHGNLLPTEEQDVKKGAHEKAIKDVAEKIVKTYGRKEILLKNITADDSAMLKSFPGGDGKTTKASEDMDGDILANKYNNQSSSQAKRRLSPCQELGLGNNQKMLTESEINGPSLAKRGRLLPEDDPDTLPHISGYNDPYFGYNESPLRMTLIHIPGLECTTVEQDLEFQTNDQLLEYLANFVIKDDEDAAFIQKISQNCIKALKNFEEEEAEMLQSSHKSEAPLAHRSGTDPETPDISGSKTESHSSGSKATLPKDPSNPPLGIPQNEATNLFFNNIKNMDESQVVAIFEKIASMNPEFQGMNIPTVIRFLKESGRLQKS